MKKNGSLWLFLIVLAPWGCQVPGRGLVEGAGYGYFPLEAGRFSEYEVKEIRYTVASPLPAQTTYHLREVCGQPFTGSGGIEQFPIERYKRKTGSGNWVLDSVWTAYRLPDRAVRVENNVAFVKLAFPFYEGSTWNGNLLNTRPGEVYEVRSDSSVSPAFPGSLTVVQRRDSSLVSLYKRNETYAPGVGLVYKQEVGWEYCQEPACIGSGKIDTGTSRIMTLTRYGRE